MKSTVKISINEDKLSGCLYLPDNQKSSKTVLFLNGSGGTKELFFSIAEELLEENYASFCFDFRGRGESTTKQVPPLSWQLEDTREVVDYLQDQNEINSRDITIVATSMGAFAGASIINEFKCITRIVLIAPAMFLPDQEDQKYTEITARDYRKDDLNKSRSITEVSSYVGDVYVVFLKRDTTIPDWMSQAYLDNAISAKRKVRFDIDSRHSILRSENGRKKLTDLLKDIL